MAELEEVEAVPDRPGRFTWLPYKAEIKRLVIRPLKMTRGLVTVPNTLLYANGARDTATLTLPRFLGIGAVKGGTTWLHHNLAPHPELFLPADKEMHFFDHQLHRGLGRYTRAFATAGDRIPGEITPSYSTLPEWRIGLVAKLIPDARIIMLVRDPVERAWSHAVMKLARERLRQPSEITTAEAVGHFTSEESLSRGMYSQILERWGNHFPPEQVFVGFYDDITDRPLGLLSDVVRHIGASTDIDWSAMPYQKVIDRGVRGGPDVVGSSTPPLPEQLRNELHQLYGDELARLAVTYGGPAQRWLERSQATG
jgi:hypothetical protein